VPPPFAGRCGVAGDGIDSYVEFQNQYYHSHQRRSSYVEHAGGRYVFVDTRYTLGALGGSYLQVGVTHHAGLGRFPFLIWTIRDLELVAFVFGFCFFFCCSWQGSVAGWECKQDDRSWSPPPDKTKALWKAAKAPRLKRAAGETADRRPISTNLVLTSWKPADFSLS
jgi:hypothetical protein